MGGEGNHIFGVLLRPWETNASTEEWRQQGKQEDDLRRGGGKRRKGRHIYGAVEYVREFFSHVK